MDNISTIKNASDRKATGAVLGAAAHELRSPVSHIKGFVSMLRHAASELDRDAQNDFLAEIESEADRLARLIEDLLETASGSGGVVRRRRATISPSALVDVSLSRMRQELGTRRIDVDVADDLPVVEVDAQSMERVLVNLVDNAHKYSPADAPIHISARVRNGTLELHVDNHGSGIPFRERTHIFEPFYRSTSTAETSEPGEGLGLAICRSIITAHHGEIRAEDRPGGGARFTVALPLKGRSGQAARIGPARSAELCAYCGMEHPTRRARVFTRAHPSGYWQLCESCWRFLEVGFEAHQPTQDLEQRLDAPVPVNAAEVRGWIKTGLRQVGRHSRAAARRR
jgi:K+-sensing histidine kinase KdpD